MRCRCTRSSCEKQRAAIDNLLNAIQQGIFTRSTKERLDELEASRDELENKIAVEKLAKPRITEEQLRFFLERFRKMDVTRKSQRKMLIDTFVNAIFLYDDKMVLTYNFHESTETITFGELQEVLPNGFRGSDMNLATEPREQFIRTHCPNSEWVRILYLSFQIPMSFLFENGG